MALSDAYKYATAEGGIGLDAYYGNINSFLANNPDQQAIANAMAQYGVSQEDVDYAKSLLNPPASGLSAVTSGKNTVLEDTSSDTASNLGSTAGALTQAASNLTDTTAGTGALNQATSGVTSTAQTDWERQQAATNAQAQIEYAAQQAEAAANVTDLGNGTFKLSDGRIVDSNGNAVTNAISGLSALNDTSNVITETGTVSGAETVTGTETSTATWPSIIYGSTDEDGRPLTQTTTTDGTPFYLHDTNDGVYYQNPATVESYAPFTGQDGKTYYAVYAPTFSSGLEWNQTPITSVLTEAQYRALQGGSTMGDAFKNILNSPVGSFALNVLGPYGQVINAANAASQGNYTGAVLSGLNAIGGFGWTDIGGVDINTAKNIAAGLNAYDKGNMAGVFTAGANLFGGVPGQYSNVANLTAAGLALKNNDTAGFMNALGNLTGSTDAKLAASAISLKNALESGNPNQVQAAFNNFGSTVGATNKVATSTSGSTGASTVADSTPLTDEEISYLNPDQLRVYQASGVAGLRDYNRDIKNLTSLTTSGYTGDSMGGGDTTTGTTTGGLTGTTRSLNGTGALTTATTTDQFEDILITSLRSQGLNNAQISTYLENLNNQSSGLSDVGLLAFRQAKISGATDAEALAAANLATGKTAVETDTETEAEIVVTDTDFETNIYSFYDTQSETETEIIVTSGQETSQPTETETETETVSDIIVTSGRETGQATELETETELVVTSGKETGQPTELETETELIVTSGIETGQPTELETETELVTEVVVTTASETQSATESETEIIVTTASETVSETETEIVVTTASETESESESETKTETVTEIVVTTSSETESETETETETETEVIVTTASETKTETETESETETEIIVTTSSETKTETETESETLTEIIVTTSSETKTETETETETITEIVVTDTVTETETETETKTKIVVTQPPVTKPSTTTSGSFTAGTPAAGARGKPTEFLKENLLKTYMTKDSFKDPLAQFNKIRQDMAKDQMMQQGVDPRLAAILAAKAVGEEPPPKKTYNYGEEPQSIDDILGLKVEGDQNFAQGGYVQPLMAQGGMALPLLAAKGGLPTMHKGREDFRHGKHVAGEGDGQSDDIPAMLADGEFVFPADVVSALGNGSTKAGTDKLYEMMHSIRDRARSKGAKDLPPPALKSPLDYLKKR